MEAALAANVLNLGRLANASNRPVVEVPTDLYTTFASIRPDVALPPTGFGLSQTSSEARDEAAGTVTVPDVGGLPARSAVRQLHRFGLRASQVGTGDVVRTVPAAGARVAPGDVIRLRYRGQPDD
jgi:hypothetical protein